MKYGTFILTIASLMCAGFVSCSKWTESESLRVDTVLPWEQNPDLWEEYKAAIRDYKSRDHQLIYVRFDIVSLTNAENFSQYDAEDMAWMKSVGTKVLYQLDFAGNPDILYDNAGLAAALDRAVETVREHGLDGFSFTGLPKDDGGVTAAASKTVTIGFKGLAGEGEDQAGAMEIDKTWLLPVRVTSDDMEVMEGSSVAYYLVKRTSAITVAAQLTDNWINFPLLDEPGTLADVYNDLTAVTYEALIYIDKFDTENSFGECNISTIMGVEQYLLLRIGDANFERQQLQFDGSGNGSQFGKLPSKSDSSKKLEAGIWYHVACTYDQATRTARIYVNGQLTDEAKDVGVTGSSEDNRITLAMQALGMEEAYRFCIGWSYNDFRPLQGKIAEARVWRVARTQQEIWDNMYRLPDYEAENYPDLIY